MYEVLGKEESMWTLWTEKDKNGTRDDFYCNAKLSFFF